MWLGWHSGYLSIMHLSYIHIQYAYILHIYFISNIRFSIYSTSIISKYSGASYSFENSANELQKISETITTKKKVQRRRAFIFITSHTLKILLAVIGSIWCVTSLWPLMSVWSGRPVWLPLLSLLHFQAPIEELVKSNATFMPNTS